MTDTWPVSADTDASAELLLPPPPPPPLALAAAAPDSCTGAKTKARFFSPAALQTQPSKTACVRPWIHRISPGNWPSTVASKYQYASRGSQCDSVARTWNSCDGMPTKTRRPPLTTERSTAPEASVSSTVSFGSELIV